MKHLMTLCIILNLIGLFSCNNRNSEEIQNKSKSAASFTNSKITIVIQPFLGFPPSQTTLVEQELKKIYSGPIVVNEPIALPSSALNSSKKRYRADSLIKYLSKKTNKRSLTIGLTDKDISTTKGENKDWGIFGLGYMPGNACIASTSRLKGTNKFEKLFKVAIHELGHTQGLDHCPEKTCLMRDAKGKDHLNELKEFCPPCKRVLIKAGWDLS
jgi:archaemetzincin